MQLAMTNDEGTSCRLLALLAIVVAIVMFVFPLCLRFPLLDPDEGLHASIAQEMVEHHEWIVPQFLGERFLDKPILYFWVQAASQRCFGFNEAAVRLPGLMFGLLGAVTTGLLAARMLGRKTGWIAGIFYATTILPTALAQAASHDVAMVPWVNLAILLLWESTPCTRYTPCVDVRTRSVRSTGRFIGCTIGTGLFLGLSILTKGLLGVAVVGLAYGGYLVMTRRVTLATVFQGAAVLTIAVLVAAPWYLAVEAQHSGFLRYYFFERHVLGAVGGQAHSDQPWWYYLPILLGGGLPWIAYVRWARRGMNESSPSVAFLWFWPIVWTVFLTLAQSKLATYLWPAFPPVAILAAVAWTRLIDGMLDDADRRSFVRSFVMSSWGGPLVLPAAVAVLQWVVSIRFGWPVWVAVALVAAASPLPLIPWYAGRRQASMAAAVLSLTAQFVVAMTLVVPQLANRYSARDLAEHFNRAGSVPSRLFMAEERVGSFVFYLTPSLRAKLKNDQLRYLPSNPPTVLQPGDVLAVKERNLAKMSDWLKLDESRYELVGPYRVYRITRSQATGLSGE